MVKLLLFSLLGFTIVIHAAPSPPDCRNFPQNAQDAQTLNREFKTLKATDPCEDGEFACIGNSIVKCEGTQWETSRGKCAQSQSCFALPSTSENGTIITCTSEKTALSLIESCGGTGGLFGADPPEQSPNSVEGPDDCNGDFNNSESNTTSSSALPAHTAPPSHQPNMTTASSTTSSSSGTITVAATTSIPPSPPQKSTVFTTLTLIASDQPDNSSTIPAPTPPPPPPTSGSPTIVPSPPPISGSPTITPSSPISDSPTIAPSSPISDSPTIAPSPSPKPDSSMTAPTPSPKPDSPPTPSPAPPPNPPSSTPTPASPKAPDTTGRHDRHTSFAPAETSILTPDEAHSLLSKLMAGGHVESSVLGAPFTILSDLAKPAPTHN